MKSRKERKEKKRETVIRELEKEGSDREGGRENKFRTNLKPFPTISYILI